MATMSVRRDADVLLACGAAGACGAGAVIALNAAITDQLAITLIGGALVGIGAVIMLAARWVDPLLALAAVLPLPALYSSPDFRLAPAFALSAALIAAHVLRSGATPRPLAAPRPDAWRLALPVGAAVCVSAAFAQATMPALRELVNWALLLALFGVAAAELRAEPARGAALARVLGIATALCGALALGQMIGVLPGRFARAGTAFNRATLGFGWPNELGMFLALGLPFAIYLHRTARDFVTRTLAACGIVATVLGLVATFSRGSWLAALLAPVSLLFIGEGRRALRVWGVALLLGAIVNTLTGGAIVDRIAGTIGDWVVEQRAALTLAGVLMFLAHPIVGVGPGGFAAALENYGPRISWLWDYLPTSQNLYVQLGAELGVLGLLAFVGFLLAVWRRALRAARTGTDTDRALRITVLWTLTTALLLGFGEWVLAHGIGQLIMLAAALALSFGDATAADRAVTR